MTSEGLQRCFVLHRRPYSESSLILDVFSEEFGRVTLSLKVRAVNAQTSKARCSLLRLYYLSGQVKDR